MCNFKILQNMSGNFLIENFPDNWKELEAEEQEEFVIENVWGPLENLTPNHTLSIIYAAAVSIEDCMKEDYEKHKDFSIKLWAATENGTVEEEFFKLREMYRELDL